MSNWAGLGYYSRARNLHKTARIVASIHKGVFPKKYDEILGLKEKNLASVLALPIGYRAEDDMKTHQMKVRKKIEDIIIEIS